MKNQHTLLYNLYVCCFFFGMLTLGSCGGSEPGQDLLGRVERLESFVYKKDAGVFNADSARALVDAYIAYVDASPKDSLAPEYLFKAGEVATSLQMGEKAIEVYHRLYTDYPEHDKGPMGLFLEAFTYDNLLKDYDKAKVLYESFIEKYPGHSFADDAQGSLDNLGVPVEELIRKWEEQEGNSQAQGAGMPSDDAPAN
ncbi:MAG: tetratricopeptide repeat protein [Flavobacteriales bacterium]|nr:tetratricopeptide repeat protein [Flavobacteriales bacterium]